MSARIIPQLPQHPPQLVIQVSDISLPWTPLVVRAPPSSERREEASTTASAEEPARTAVAMIAPAKDGARGVGARGGAHEGFGGGAVVAACAARGTGVAAHPAVGVGAPVEEAHRAVLCPQLKLL